MCESDDSSIFWEGEYGDNIKFDGYLFIDIPYEFINKIDAIV